jgi:copper transport protein
VLACKLAAVAVLLGLAAINRYRLVPRFMAEGVAAAPALAASLACELVIALGILALVALWRFTPPPRALAAAAPISIHIHGEKAMIEIDRDRAPGRGASLTVLDGAFRPLAVKEVALVFANPAAGIEPMRRAATRAGAGADASLWRVEDLRIPFAGRWTVRAELLVGDFEKLTIEDTFVLPRVP